MARKKIVKTEDETGKIWYERRFTRLELLEDRSITELLNNRCWHLLGMGDVKDVRTFRSLDTGDLIIKYTK